MIERASPPSEIPTVLCHCSALRTAARRATALYDKAMAPFGLRISQFGILARLRRLGPMSLHALATELVLDRTTLGRNLAPLERDGLVASEADPTDRRVRRLVITDAGLAMMRRALPAWNSAQHAYEAQYGVAQSVALRDDLHRLTAALQAEPGAGDAE
jgi:DNA-binding MarR family transcriptional regulator